MNSRGVIASSDVERLHTLIDSSESPRRNQKRLRALSDELAAANVIDGERVPASVIAMNSYVEFTDLDTGRRHEYQVVFPPDADLSRNKVSVLAPIGTALLGQRVGTEVECSTPRGVRRFRIERVRQKTPAEDQAAATGLQRLRRLDFFVLVMGALRRWYWQLTQRKSLRLDSGWHSR